MNFPKVLKKIWSFLKEDSWESWVVSLLIAFVVIKFIFFPVLSFALATPLPLVVVESCSMYHSLDFDNWWDRNGGWYEEHDIEKEDFEDFSFSNGLNKGDIILVSGRGDYDVGDVIIFEVNGASFKFPLIHRTVGTDPINTKGDNGNTNPDQLTEERDIPEENVFGKSLVRIPGLGWAKLIFFESSRPSHERGLC